MSVAEIHVTFYGTMAGGILNRTMPRLGYSLQHGNDDESHRMLVTPFAESENNPLDNVDRRRLAKGQRLYLYSRYLIGDKTGIMSMRVFQYCGPTQIRPLF